MYTYKVRIHPNNKQDTKIKRTLNNCIECQNIVYDYLDLFVRYFNKLGQYPVRKSYKDKKKFFYVDPFKIEFTDRKVRLEKIANNQKANRQVLNYVSLAEKDRIPTNVTYYNPRVSYDGEHFL